MVASDGTDEPLVFTTKGVWSWLTGIVALAVGAIVIWLALNRPGEANAWVPWVVGGMFGALGLFELLGRSRVVFDPASRTWSDRWGILMFEFSSDGTFDQLERIRVEASERKHGQFTYYIWVLGRGDTRILADHTLIEDEAAQIARKLQAVLDLPVDNTHS